MKNKMFVIFIALCSLARAEPLLFQKFTRLKEKIPHISLCDVPTPIHKLNLLGEKLGHHYLYIKRDDLTGMVKDGAHLYGGNKVRKLEWLLADALQQHADTIVTYGCAGSNHAASTAVYAHELGFKTILMLKPQPNSAVVQHNLLLNLAIGAEMRHYENNTARDLARQKYMIEHPQAYFIPTGGSTPLGALGFVNAAFELKKQIAASIMPTPDIIYLPIGSCGTAAGLLLGLVLADLPSKIVAVAVEPEEKPGIFEATTKKLFEETNNLLHDADATISLVKFPEHLFMVNKQFCGTSYGLWTNGDVEAMRLLKELEGIIVEGTYSTKPVCALIADSAYRFGTNKTVLLWDTYCGLSFESLLNSHTYQDLPQEFHHYFD